MVSSLSQGLSAYKVIAASSGHSSRTIEAVEGSLKSLRNFLGDDVPLADIAVADIRRWVMALRQRRLWQGLPQEKDRSVSATTINGRVRGVKAFFFVLAKEGLIDRHPVLAMPAPKPARTAVKPFTQPELRRIFEALKRTRHPYRNRAITALLFDPGLRLSEAVGLTWDRVNLTERNLSVLGKGNKERLLSLSAWTAKQLLLY